MLNYEKASAPLAQLDRVSVYGTEGWGFELLMVRHEERKSIVIYVLLYSKQKKSYKNVRLYFYLFVFENASNSPMLTPENEWL